MVVTYREMPENNAPVVKSLLVRWDEEASLKVPQEEVDLTGFCTSQEHAEMVARFLLSIRRRIDHTVQFKTDPKQLGLAPGNYIVITTSAAVESSGLGINGVVNVEDGAILCTDELADGIHEVSMYVAQAARVETVQLEVKNNRVEDKQYWGSVFSLIVPRPEQNLYQVESIEIDEDGLANVAASHYPATKVDGRWRSLIAEDVLDEDGSRFYIIQ